MQIFKFTNKVPEPNKVWETLKDIHIEDTKGIPEIQLKALMYIVLITGKDFKKVKEVINRFLDGKSDALSLRKTVIKALESSKTYPGLAVNVTPRDYTVNPHYSEFYYDYDSEYRDLFFWVKSLTIRSTDKSLGDLFKVIFPGISNTLLTHVILDSECALSTDPFIKELTYFSFVYYCMNNKIDALSKLIKIDYSKADKLMPSTVTSYDKFRDMIYDDILYTFNTNNTLKLPITVGKYIKVIESKGDHCEA